MKKETPHVIALSGAQGNNYLLRTAQIQVEMRRKVVVLERMHGKQIQHVGKLRIQQIGD
jgi:hypothetical protein